MAGTILGACWLTYQSLGPRLTKVQAKPRTRAGSIGRGAASDCRTLDHDAMVFADEWPVQISTQPQRNIWITTFGVRWP